VIPSAPLASRSCQLTLIALGLDLLAEEVLRAVGAEGIERRSQISKPGLAIHEVGTARMGDDPKTSVVNRWQQAHDVSNLFVMDGAVYPSSPCQNPTITIMALAARACDHLVEELKRGRV
jgi:choline dehydrogenase-like flavoprotein